MKQHDNNGDLSALHEQTLDRYRKAWEQARYSAAVAEAIYFCGIFQLPMPEWLWQAASALILNKQTPAERQRLHNSAIDHYRYYT